ncbi:glutamate receptor [Culex quinquefasciatus]|uniref:Glutamate receptor n=1 Tax=Culex quinquefasciatus TaxID=7176 RepID=B0WHP1_CULQU|nr:glutamate receptor [Culex quinquefasciatus]|eukprot:XP_001848225.1 glutamate receptor [Culex quinquefasciatus]
MWWFFTLIMISSYTANLAAFLTVERMDSPIESAEDLAKQTKIKYGALRGGSTAAFFRDSNFSTYQRMWSFMEASRPSVFTASNIEGVERVVKGKGSYAFLMESTSIEYVIERNCELTQVGGMLDSKGYGIAMPPNSPFRTAISGAVLKLQEEGKLHILKTRWWKEKRGGGSCRDDTSKSSSTANELGLANVGGVFVVLMGGMGVACVIAVCEFVWKSRKVAVEERVSLCSEMASELRFALKRNRSKSSDHNTTATTFRTTASSRASPKDSEPSSEHRFHPLGPPYAQYEFDPKAVGQLHVKPPPGVINVGSWDKHTVRIDWDWIAVCVNNCVMSCHNLLTVVVSWVSPLERNATQYTFPQRDKPLTMEKKNNNNNNATRALGKISHGDGSSTCDSCLSGRPIATGPVSRPTPLSLPSKLTVKSCHRSS